MHRIYTRLFFELVNSGYWAQ